MPNEGPGLRFMMNQNRQMEGVGGYLGCMMNRNRHMRVPVREESSLPLGRGRDPPAREDRAPLASKQESLLLHLRHEETESFLQSSAAEESSFSKKTDKPHQDIEKEESSVYPSVGKKRPPSLARFVYGSNRKPTTHT